MTNEIKDKLKKVVDTNCIIGSDLADYIIDLERKIEKMKNCENCEYKTPSGCDFCGSVENCEEYQYWKLKK